MNRSIVLSNGALKAVFLPDQGMTLSSFSKGEIEVIDPNSRKRFLESAAGLGCLIGPHFYKQKPEWITPVKQPHLFPHLIHTLKDGAKDPFPHGIGRYAPWRYEATQDTVNAHLCGADTWQGIPLAELEGTDFSMSFKAKLTPQGLDLTLDVSSSRLSIIGLHYYYALPPGKATVSSLIQNQYNDMGVFKPLDAKSHWLKNGELCFDLQEAADYGFLPLNGHSGKVLLTTQTHALQISYQGAPDEVSWQLYHPKDATFVCIEPMSVKNPRGLTTKTSSLKVQIEIFMS